MLDYINDFVIEKYESPYNTDVKLKSPLSATYVRALSQDQFGSDCRGELVVSFTATYGTVEPVNREYEIYVNYELFKADDQSEWITILEWDSR